MKKQTARQSVSFAIATIRDSVVECRGSIGTLQVFDVEMYFFYLLRSVHRKAFNKESLCDRVSRYGTRGGGVIIT